MTAARAIRILFVCVENAGRSQMAAALLNHHARGRASADSAGTRPAQRVHEVVVEVMHEVGIDLAAAQPKILTPEMAASADRLVTMGCGDQCPAVATPMEDWNLPDPAGRSPDEVREIRDEIDRRVQALLDRITS